MKKILKRLARAQEGVAYLEFAITIPFLLALFMGGVEVTRYIIIAQKLEKAAVTVSDVVAQSEEITTTELDTIILAAGQVMLPYSFEGDGYVIISSVTQNGSTPIVNWQYTGGGDWIQSSQIGGPGETATLPNDLTLIDNDTVIISEVFYNFTPLLENSVVDSSQLYKVGVFKPRLGDLTSLGS